ncbi:tetratricopeptide repeat protein [Chryseobacterium sp. FH1]|uniref:tetratricopeptide repeat protein n=1 Tax=Chryseobacterium sp. FH1 TaxID=1233951 RepID=UPI0004E28EA3|nr:tetratricopeptide repeat protein [Chryseobacterium sp. FH1]KFC19317.1 hypothetical protein IO90_08390 [Chryseobacterium sp. FH1]
MNINSSSCNEIICRIKNKLQNKEVAIFCGAGISYNSGLPLVNNLLKYILKVIDVNENDSKILLNSNLPFEAFIQTLSNETNIDDILNIFTKGQPNDSHQLIALLIKLGFVKNIITTNFDTLIEDALLEMKLINSTHYHVFSCDEEFKNIDWNDGNVKLIKIHGCISNKKEVEITLDLVARQYISQNKHKTISSFFSEKINPNVLFLGYSCSDHFDITPQIQLITQNQSHIIFIEHSFDENSCVVEKIDFKKYNNPFDLYNGVRIYYNTDFLVRQLWEQFSSETLKKHFSEPINWSENINIWIQKESQYSLAIKNQLAARLFYDIGEYNISIQIWQKGLHIAQSENNQLFFYAQLGNLGMALNATGRFPEAQKCLEESSKVCREIGNTQGEISQLQALGSVYRNLEDYDNAAKAFERAVFLAENYYVESLCPSLGNLATVYNQTGQVEKAIKTLQKGLPIAKITGNKQSEGSMYTSLGVALFKKGDYKTSKILLQKGIDITRQIGDRQGECMSLHNLANVSLQLGDYDNCIKYAHECLKIALEINIEPSQGGSYYNLGTVHLLKGNKELAVEYLKKSLEINMKIYGLKHSNTIFAKKILDKAMNS